MNVYTSHRRRYEASFAQRFMSEAFDRLTAYQQLTQILAEHLEGELSHAIVTGALSEVA